MGHRDSPDVREPLLRGESGKMEAIQPTEQPGKTGKRAREPMGIDTLRFWVKKPGRIAFHG